MFSKTDAKMATTFISIVLNFSAIVAAEVKKNILSMEGTQWFLYIFILTSLIIQDVKLLSYKARWNIKFLLRELSTDVALLMTEPSG